MDKFECLWENREKYITFSVFNKKELDNGKPITYKLKFIDSFRFMSTSLPTLVNNFFEIYSKDCKRMWRKKNPIYMQFYWAWK